MAYDQSRHMIYVSVPNTGGSHSNTVTEVDPVSGSIGKSVFVGSNPGDITVTDDGRYVYVAVDGGIRRVNASSMTADTLIDPGHDETWGQYMVEDVEAVPGHPEEVAATLRGQYSSDFLCCGIYRDGKCLTDSISVYNGHSSGPNVIKFGPGDTLYGYDNRSECQFYTMQVGSTGLAISKCSGTPWQLDCSFKYDNGRLYLSTGAVYDAATMSMVGTFPAHGMVVPDSAKNRMYIVDDLHRLCVLNLSTFVLLGQVDLSSVKGSLTSCIECGEGTVAVGTSGGQLGIVDASRLAGTPSAQSGRPSKL